MREILKKIGQSKYATTYCIRFIEAELQNMKQEIKDSVAGQRIAFYKGTELKFSSNKSTFPNWYKINFPTVGRERLLKCFSNVTSNLYPQLIEIAILRLEYGYSEVPHGYNDPCEEFSKAAIL